MAGVNALKNVMLLENVDIKVVDYIAKLAYAIGYHDTYFVSNAGNNADGLSWDTAYTSLSSAMTDMASNQASSDQLDVIMLGVGSHDLSRTTAITDNVFFIGSGKHLTTLANTGSGTAEVIQSTGMLGLFNLTVDIGATAIEGIYIGSTSANGSIISNVFVDCSAASGAQGAIYLDDSVAYVQMNDVEIEGVAANTTAIHLNDANRCDVKDIYIGTALIGVHLDHADDDDNGFSDVVIATATTGIQIDNAGSTGNHFENIHFVGGTTRITDSGTSTAFTNITADMFNTSIAPADLTGVAVTAAVGANTWTVADVEIRSAAAATAPFYITGIVFEVDTAERWGIRLTDDGGTTYFYDKVIEGAVNIADNIIFNEKYLVAQSTAIDSVVKSETGGNDMDIWITIEAI